MVSHRHRRVLPTPPMISSRKNAFCLPKVVGNDIKLKNDEGSVCCIEKLAAGEIGNKMSVLPTPKGMYGFEPQRWLKSGLKRNGESEV